MSNYLDYIIVGKVNRNNGINNHIYYELHFLDNTHFYIDYKYDIKFCTIYFNTTTITSFNDKIPNKYIINKIKCPKNLIQIYITRTNLKQCNKILYKINKSNHILLYWFSGYFCTYFEHFIDKFQQYINYIHLFKQFSKNKFLSDELNIIIYNFLTI
jgi:hypothetical protein